MCGIAVIMRTWPAGEDIPPLDVSIPDAWLDAMDAAIASRGPDGAGRLKDRTVDASGATVDVALVHRRLAVIDPVGGAQPMTDESADQLHAVVFNGCVYNHRVLRDQLIEDGIRFETDHSDTEVVLRGFAAQGERFFEACDGMYAIAAWDRDAATLTLARDIAGEKPLMYATHDAANDADNGAVNSSVHYACSNMAGLIACQRAMQEDQGKVECTALTHWLTNGWHDRLPLENATEVQPGEVVQWTSKGIASVRRVQHPPRSQRARGASPRDVVATVDQLLTDAVASRLESDVPLGCFLSGGIDSALIAVKAKAALGQLTTLTVRMPDAKYDESPTAERIANALGTNHITVECGTNAADDMVRLIEGIGLPFGDSSLLPAYWLSQASREHVTVALSGDGGDELFGGYRRHALAQRDGLMRLIGRCLPLGLGAHANPKSRLATLHRIARWSRFGHGAIFDQLAIKGVLTPNTPLPDVPARSADIMCDDFLRYLPFDLLRKTDSASMAAPIEVRCPFLAPKLIAFGLTTPASVLMPNGQRKGLLKAVARAALPEVIADIVDRPKMGFAIPVDAWFRSDFGGLRSLYIDAAHASEPFGADSLGVASIVDASSMIALLKAHDRGAHMGQQLYMLLALSIWSRWISNTK